MVLEEVYRWCYRRHRFVIALCLFGVIFGCYFIWVAREEPWRELIYDRDAAWRDTERSLREALELDKGTGCDLPRLDPFAPEATQFDERRGSIRCRGQDWIKCYHSTCRLVDSIKASLTDVTCVYEDILYQNDYHYTYGHPILVRGGDEYKLKASDHVTVTCTGKRSGNAARWAGIAQGLRDVTPAPSPPGREESFNILIFAFDSTSRSGFIRLMPKSWAALKEIGATDMEGYNIVGDATVSALMPILTGRTLLELPEVRRGLCSNCSVDSFPLIFYKLREDGYHTAYFEDSPHQATFSRRYYGFRRQPTDHYLRFFFLLHRARNQRHWTRRDSDYCVGDTPQFKLMINITQQFMELRGKRFIFTFIADITHYDFNDIQYGDNDTAAFLRSLTKYTEDTLIVVMGDHGSRYSKRRATLRGKLDERLPLMAVRLPSRLARARPHAQRALEANARALTTPHDLHATILDVLGWRQHWNTYKIPGADLLRGVTMLEEIPRNRSCSEAGIEPHWCSCLVWRNVSTADPIYNDTGIALILYINELIRGVRSRCAPRTLVSIEWVLRHEVNPGVLSYKTSRDRDLYYPSFGENATISMKRYQIKIVADPGRAEYEATMTYILKQNKFIINERDISRTNEYGSQPECISSTYPHLMPFCYCH